MVRSQRLVGSWRHYLHVFWSPKYAGSFLKWYQRSSFCWKRVLRIFLEENWCKKQVVCNMFDLYICSFHNLVKCLRWRGYHHSPYSMSPPARRSFCRPKVNPIMFILIGFSFFTSNDASQSAASDGISHDLKYTIFLQISHILWFSKRLCFAPSLLLQGKNDYVHIWNGKTAYVHIHSFGGKPHPILQGQKRLCRNMIVFAWLFQTIVTKHNGFCHCVHCSSHAF